MPPDFRPALLRAVLCLPVVLLLSAPAAGQASAPAGQESAPPVPEHLRSARATLDAFFSGQNAAEVPWERVTSTLAFEDDAPPEARRLAASRLKSVLDGRGLFVRVGNAPANPDYQNPETRQPEFTPFPIQLPAFEIRRGPDLAWRISANTVRAAEGLYEETFSWYARRLREFLPPVVGRSFLGFTLWQGIGLLILAALAFGAEQVLKLFFRLFLIRFAERRSDWTAEDLSAAAAPASWLATVWIFRRFLADLRFPVQVNQGLNLLLDLAFAGIAVWLAFRAIDALSTRIQILAGRTETKLDDHLVPLARNTLRVGSVIAAFVFIAHAHGYSVTTLVAGLGLGGLAIALAAQDTLANVMGSLAIVADRPFQVGDWVLVDGYEGHVERVGLRSTRVRTFYDSVVSVPNSKMVNSIVDNMGQRQYRRMKHLLALRYDTDPDRIHDFVEGIRAIIRENPAMRQDKYEIHLNRFADSSVDVLVYCFFKVPDWNAELTERHHFLLKILRLAKELGVEFAFPTRTLAFDNAPPAASPLPPDPEPPA